MSLLTFGLICYVGTIIYMAGGAGNHVRSGSRSGKHSKSKSQNIIPFMLFGGILIALYIVMNPNETLSLLRKIGLHNSSPDEESCNQCSECSKV